MVSESERSFYRTHSLFFIIFFPTLLLDTTTFNVYNDMKHMVPHLEFLTAVTSRIKHVLSLFMAIRLLSCAIIFHIMMKYGDKAIYYRLLTALMGTAYVLSIRDSYQHHYLIILILFILALENETRSRILNSHARILRLAGVVYLYTTITKLDTASFMNGEMLCNQIMFTPEMDTLYGYMIEWFYIPILRMDISTSLGQIGVICVALSWSVIAIELYLGFNLLLNPFHVTNAPLMFLLHFGIGVFEYISPLMNTNMFSVHMFAIAALAIPPTDYYTRWIDYVLPAWLWKRQCTLSITNTRPRTVSICNKIVVIVFTLFIVWQAAIPYVRCYHGRPIALFMGNPKEEYIDLMVNNPGLLDERFCWRMFSGLANRECESSYEFVTGNNMNGSRRSWEVDVFKPRLVENPQNARIRAVMACLKSKKETIAAYEFMNVANMDTMYYNVTYSSACVLYYDNSRPKKPIVLADMESVEC